LAGEKADVRENEKLWQTLSRGMTALPVSVGSTLLLLEALGLF
jgi:hypothetical protein